MEKSESIKSLVAALIKFNTSVSTIAKSSNNPFFKSKYAALPDILNAINQPLIDCGLTVNQFPEGEHGLTTILSHESGEYIMATYYMHPSKNDPQGIGSCITYQRRYALGAVLNLNIDEDDDGNAASHNNGAPQPKTTPETTQSEDTRDWLSEANFNKAMELITAGDVSVYEKTVKKYRLKKAYREQLQAAVNGVNGK